MFLLGAVPALFLAVLFLMELKEGSAILCLMAPTIGIFGAIAFVGLRVARSGWRRLGVRVLVFPSRLVYARCKRLVTYRWGDIEVVSYKAEDRYYAGATYLDSTYFYVFRHRCGHSFTFEEVVHRNREEPLAQLVNAALLASQLPALRERLVRGGEVLHFGPLSLSQEGIGYGRTILPWAEVDYVWAKEGRVKVRKQGKFLNWCSVGTGRVSHCCVFLALAKELREKADPEADGAGRA
jgi:hypothetical protein